MHMRAFQPEESVSTHGVSIRCPSFSMRLAWGICLVALLAPLTSPAVVITGTVIGEGARPLAGAAVQVMRDSSTPICATTTSTDGTFSLPCAAIGRYAVRASLGALRAWEIDDVELEPGSELHLNFMLLPAAEEAPMGDVPGATADAAGFWSRTVPNPVLATWHGSTITLRMLAIGIAALSFVLGGLTMLALGRRFGIQTRRLSAGEVGDMVLNPHMPAAGERLTPIAVAGARGASANVSYGSDEMAAALAAKRYGLVVVALVVAPGLFALFSLALAVAMLVGQEIYLLCAMLVVPAGFVLTAVIIATQALARAKSAADRGGEIAKSIIAVLAWSLTLAGVATTAAAACLGDCNGDGTVTVNELIIGVNIALDRLSVDQCAPLDASGDGRIAVNELVSAVNAVLAGCAPERLIALSRDGEIATLDVAAPWTLRTASDLGATISSARCRGGNCLVVHPSPADAISIVAAADLALLDTITLARGADPRDVTFVDSRTIVVSQYGRAEALEIDLVTRATTPIDLSVLADADGLPETLRLASCGRRVFAQLRRVDHVTEAPAPIGAALAVIDLEREGSERVIDVDPAAPGVQGIALAGRPAFDMPVDCAAGILYVAEPVPLMQGGGGYEQVDLGTLSASELPIATGAEVGGFEVVEPGLYWLITHTDFGPGASSHLTLVGGPTPDTHNTFASEHVNDVALDRDQDLLFFPDPCMRTPSNQSCDTGLHVFHAHSGARATAEAIDVGFAPIEVVVAR